MQYKIKLLFAWYDFWVGVFYDRKKKVIYIFPVPMLGIAIQAISKPKKKSRCCARCDGHSDICITDDTCIPHNERGCYICWPDPE